MPTSVEPTSAKPTSRVLDNVQRVLNAVSAFPEASEIDRQKQELMRIRYEELARNEKRKQGTGPLVNTSNSQSGLKPWREIVSPHPDVASGRYNMAEFAANLAQVHRGGGEEDYRDPRTFFTRIFLHKNYTNTTSISFRVVLFPGKDLGICY